MEKVTKKKRQVQISSDEAEDAQCLYCQYLYSESTEGWIQCSDCQLWSHCSCAGVDDIDNKIVFVCENCQYFFCLNNIFL